MIRTMASPILPAGFDFPASSYESGYGQGKSGEWIYEYFNIQNPAERLRAVSFLEIHGRFKRVIQNVRSSPLAPYDIQFFTE